MLSSDLDVMEEVLDGYRWLVKVQLCGPWTLDATLELPRTLNVAIADPGRSRIEYRNRARLPRWVGRKRPGGQVRRYSILALME